VRRKGIHIPLKEICIPLFDLSISSRDLYKLHKEISISPEEICIFLEEIPESKSDLTTFRPLQPNSQPSLHCLARKTKNPSQARWVFDVCPEGFEPPTC